MTTPGAEKAIRKLNQWISRDAWAEALDQTIEAHLAPACEDFGVDRDDLEAELGPDLMTLPIVCAMEDFVASGADADGRNPIDDFLKRRGWNESAAVKRYLEALRNSTMSLYEVTAVTPGRHFDARDLLHGGDPIRIEAPDLSKGIMIWDHIGARVLPIGGRNYIGSGTLDFAPGDAEPFLALLRSVLGSSQDAESGSPDDPPPEPASPSDIAPLFTRYWLDIIFAANAEEGDEDDPLDGEEEEGQEFALVCFPVAADDAEAVARRLDGAEAFARLDPDIQAWSWLAAEDAAAGLLVLNEEDGMLRLGLNSRDDAERVRDALADLLGPLVGTARIDIHDLDEDGEDDLDEGPQVPYELAERVLRQTMDKFWRRAIDQPQAEFDGRTPRALAQAGAEDRRRLVAWLKMVENKDMAAARSDGRTPHDFAPVWEELGIADLRR